MVLPRTFQDRVAFLFLIFCITSVYVFEMFVVLPKVGGGYTIFWHVQWACGLYVVANIFGNLFLLKRNDSSSRKLILPSKLQPGWSFCSSCEANSPPRSFHCPVCETCILKRDHHCVFAGCCVGHYNTRYFVAILLHMLFGCLYAAILNVRFMRGLIGDFEWKSALMYLCPFAFWITGYVDAKTTVWSFLSVVSALGAIFTAVLLYVHGQQILKNQTSHESKISKITKYDLGWRQNLVEALGTNWKFIWVWPTIPSPLPSDGVTFTTKSEFNLRSAKRK